MPVRSVCRDSHFRHLDQAGYPQVKRLTRLIQLAALLEGPGHSSDEGGLLERR